MRFLSISMESFCSIGKAEFALADQGLVVVAGKNKDAESASSNASGKCFSPGTMVLMFDGSAKAVESIGIGDRVMGDDSTPRTVLATHSGVDQMFSVLPKKGDPYVVNKEHILVFHIGSRKGRAPKQVEKYITHDQSVHIPVKDYLKLPFWVRNLLIGYKAPVDFAAQDVPLDPYFFGVWLGNGTTGCAEVCTPHDEVLACIRETASNFGLHVTTSGPNRTAPVYRIAGCGRKVKNPLRELLREMGVLFRKCIPDNYRLNSRAVRLSILAGLLDTDGYLMPDYRTFEFSSKFQHIADDVVFIARSLGLFATIKARLKSCQTGATGLYYIVNIGGDTSDIPTRVSYKKAKPRKMHKNVLHTGIRSVTPVGIGDYYGFQTDGNHLFLLADFTVVHNSTAVVDSICWALFGKTTKGGSADSITPNGKGKGTMVSVVVEQGGATYTIARHRKHKTNGSKLLVSKDGTDITKATADDTEKLLGSILGITFDTFLYTTILGQGLMFRFSQLTDQNRKEILENIAGSAIYETARTAARDDARNKASAAVATEASLQQIAHSITQFQSTIASLEHSQQNAVRAYEEQRAKYDQEIVRWTAALEAYRQQPITPEPNQELIALMRATEQKAMTAAYATDSDARVVSAKRQAAEARLAKLGSIGDTCDKCGSILDNSHLIAEKEERTKEVALLNVEATELAAKHMAAWTSHKTILAKLNELVAQESQAIRANKARADSIANAEQSIRNLEGQKAAITCADYEPSIAKVRGQISATELTLGFRQQELGVQKKEQEYADFWVTGFQELRVAAIDNLLSFLNSRLAHYCSILCGDDIKVALSHSDKGKIDLGVTTAGGTYASASGGEKTRIDVGLAFALHDLACQCTNWHSNILVLDEIGVFLDAPGIERLMKLVSEKMDRVDSAFIISHDPTFEGHGDRVMTIVKENGVSSLETA